MKPEERDEKIRQEFDRGYQQCLKDGPPNLEEFQHIHVRAQEGRSNLNDVHILLAEVSRLRSPAMLEFVVKRAVELAREDYRIIYDEDYDTGTTSYVEYAMEPEEILAQIMQELK